MWDTIKIFVDIVILGWSIFSGEEERRRAAEEAAMWRSIFWVAVIIIAVLVFIIWKKHKRAKKPE